MKEKYRVSFQGELAEGANLEDVKAQLKADYGLDDETVSQWFSGERVVLRASVEEEELPQFRTYFESLGMILYITPHAWQHSSADAARRAEIADYEADQAELDAQLREEREPQSERATRGKSGEDGKDSREIPADLEATLDELKSAIKENKHAFLFRPANLGLRTIAFMIDSFIFVFLLGFIIQFLLIPLGIIDPLFNELSQYIVSGVGTGILDVAQLQNALSGDAMMEYIGQAMNLDAETVARFQNVDVIKERNTIAFSAFLFSCLYFGLLESSKMQASIGKRLFNIRVYSLNSPATRFTQAFLRVVLFSLAINLSQVFNMLIPGIGSMVMIVALGMAFFDRRGLRQTLFDRLSNTCVGYNQQSIFRNEK